MKSDRAEALLRASEKQRCRVKVRNCLHDHVFLEVAHHNLCFERFDQICITITILVSRTARAVFDNFEFSSLVFVFGLNNRDVLRFLDRLQMLEIFVSLAATSLALVLPDRI
jgi:hypothetical protein